MNYTILTNNPYKKLKDYYSEMDDGVDGIFIATAFYSFNSFINNWLDSNIRIHLLISLRPPTNYYALKNIYNNKNIDINFMKHNFHSKFTIFNNNNVALGGILGSSNFTLGGLEKNIETNIISNDAIFSEKLSKHFKEIWEQSFSLEPCDLRDYKQVYDKFCKRNETTDEDAFLKRITENRNITKKADIIKEAKQYLVFWKYVDEIKEFVIDISENEYPGIPPYLTIDHFWHWVKIIWGKVNTKLSSPNQQIIRTMFKEFCKWDKQGKKYTETMYKKSEKLFKEYLSEGKIRSLTIEKAKEVYSNLHSGEARSNRFSSDVKFVQVNSLNKIIDTFHYLLYSNDDIATKIHNLRKNENFRLEEFGLSAIQELIGWVYTEKYPIRNDKADTAIEMLGYKL